MNLRFFGYILLTGAVTLAVFVLYRNSGTAEGSLIFSPVQLLNSTWLTYKSTYVDPTTYRTIDRTRGDVTTSEGQSYTMLRSVWVGDKQTFDGTWGWTQANMFHTQDHLFAWLWGKKTNGQMGVLIEQNGETSASDADTDIALSLIFAYARWQDPKYLAASRGIIQDIWNKEVLVVGTTPYMTADDIEKTTTNPFAAVNPSYLNPAAYKIFALIDWAHPWHSLAENSYVVLQQSTILSLDKNKSAHIPPDWIGVNKTTGKLEALQGSKTHTSNFGFDALRIPFRLALDWEWFKDPRDIEVIKEETLLTNEWAQTHKLSSTFAHDGTVLNAAESPALYGGTIGYFILTSPSDAQEVYQKKLAYLYDPGSYTWKQPLSYYDDNWAWFGIALYNNLLPNLAANLPSTAFRQ